MNYSLFVLVATLFLSAIAGCSTGITPTSTGGVPTAPKAQAASHIYTTANGSVLQFSATTSGSVEPTATLSLPSGLSPSMIATDNSGQIYVVASSPSTLESILAYPAGSPIPSRTINLPLLNGSPYLIYAIAVDSAGLLYVEYDYNLPDNTVSGENVPGVNIYSATASGTAIPARTITGSATGLTEAVNDMAVDSVGNIYVAENIPYSTGIVVFSPTANGNVAPSRTISSSSYSLDSVAVDSNGDVFTAGNPLNETSATFGVILEFSSTASGNATPINIITPAGVPSGDIYKVRLNHISNLYAVSRSIVPPLYPSSFYGLNPSATGTSTPFVQFSSTVLNDNTSIDPSLALD